MTLEEAIESINDYINEGIQTGDFLQAVLANDLRDAVCRADPESYANLKSIIQYVYHEVPGNICGTRENIKNHLRTHNARRAS